MTGFLYHLGGFCSRHRLPVLATWLVIAVGLALGSAHFGSQASDNVSLPGTGSQQVTDLLEQRLPRSGERLLADRAARARRADA